MPEKKYRVPRIPVDGVLGDEEVDAVRRVIDSHKTLSCGEQRDLFERDFANYVGTNNALSVTNCTVALEFATYLANLKPGDEVIVTPFTYQATSQHLLSEPVTVKFCDIDRNSLAIDPVRLSEMITSKTKAIYLVHYGGLMANMNEIMSIAKKRSAVVIEDCAHAIGSEIDGKLAGSTGDIGCFSFQSYKNMTTLGEGGMLTFSNSKWRKTIKNITSIEPDADFRNVSDVKFGSYQKPTQGLDLHEKNSYSQECVRIRRYGTNSTLSEPAAAVGIVQLKKVDQSNEKRREIAKRIDDELSKFSCLRLQIVPPGYKHVHHFYTFFIQDDCSLDRDLLIGRIDDSGVKIVQRYFPNHLFPEWRSRGHYFGECPVTEKIWFEKVVNLPIYPQMTDDQIDYMIEVVKKQVKVGLSNKKA